MKVTAKLVPDEDFTRAAAGEWIHLPMPGGLPAHPGQPYILLSCCNTGFASCSIQLFTLLCLCCASAAVLALHLACSNCGTWQGTKVDDLGCMGFESAPRTTAAEVLRPLCSTMLLQMLYMPNCKTLSTGALRFLFGRLFSLIL